MQQEKEPGITQSSLSSASESAAILSEITEFVPLQWLQSPLILSGVNKSQATQKGGLWLAQLRVCHIVAELSCCQASLCLQLAGSISPARGNHLLSDNGSRFSSTCATIFPFLPFRDHLRVLISPIA